MVYNPFKISKVQFATHGDSRGNLVAVESGNDIPFTVRRVYYIYDTQSGVTRGFHAHKKLEQILICVSGSCKIRLDNGKEKIEVLLDSPDQGLYVAHSVWREMYDFSPDAVLLVLASELYDESDYIRNYESFLEYVSSQNEYVSFEEVK